MENARNNQVAIRLSDQEQDLILKAARLEGVKKSEFMREAAKEIARRLLQRVGIRDV